MGAQILKQGDATSRFAIENATQTAETELRSILNDIQARYKSFEDLKAFLERMVRENPHAVMVLCNRVSSVVRGDLISLEYLQSLTINSFNVRVASGEIGAETLRDQYLRSHGLKLDHNARPSPEPQEIEA